MLCCRVCIEANHPSRPCQRNIQLLALNHPQASAAKCFCAINQDQGHIGGHLLLMSKFRHAVCNQGEALRVHCDSDCRLTAPSCCQTHTHTHAHQKSMQLQDFVSECQLGCEIKDVLVCCLCCWQVERCMARLLQGAGPCCCMCVSVRKHHIGAAPIHLTVGEFPLECILLISCQC